MRWVVTAPVDHANAQANHVNRQEDHAKDQGDHSKLQGDHQQGFKVFGDFREMPRASGFSQSPIANCGFQRES
jgi:hypothetical protein